MQTKIVIFSGAETNKYGMPEPFHFYGLFASPSRDGKSYFITRIGLSADISPQTTSTSIVVANSEAEALNKAIAELQNHPTNRGLQMQTGNLQGFQL